MSAASITAANTNYSQIKASLSGKTITNFKVVPGYGYSWTENGVARSAKQSYVEANDSDFINTINNLMGTITTDNGKGLTTTATTSSITSNPIFKYALYAVGAFVLLKYVFKVNLFGGKRRR